MRNKVKDAEMQYVDEKIVQVVEGTSRFFNLVLINHRRSDELVNIFTLQIKK